MSMVANNRETAWRTTGARWLLLGAMLALLALLFYDGVAELLRVWSRRQEYSHGFFIPLISAYLIWQKRDELAQAPLKGSWLGVAVCVLGAAALIAGELGSLYIVMQYALLIVLIGLTLSWSGWMGLRLLWAPLLFLFFMIPLPPFLYNDLSQSLQLVSSVLGVGIIRVCNISVLLEGNVIDLGSYKLQVAEACSGLRYLFPLMSFGFICAYLFKAPILDRLVIFFSTIPITILMNSFRIGVIGILVEYWGIDAAEGFLHYFEGWAIFMASVALLFGEIWLLAWLRGMHRPFRDVFEFRWHTQVSHDEMLKPRPVSRAYLGSVAVLVAAVAGSYILSERVEAVPNAKSFSQFPLEVGEWHGRPTRMEAVYVKALKLSDYMLVNYTNSASEWVNFYVAYYESQQAGGSAHSPRSCIPGGGWEIRNLSKHAIDGAETAGRPLIVNRVEIQRGEDKQLVYYWFQQRGRVLTSEYLVKWYLFWDAVKRNRTDGALVRLTSPLEPGEEWASADARLQGFARALDGRLDDYVPN